MWPWADFTQRQAAGQREYPTWTHKRRPPIISEAELIGVPWGCARPAPGAPPPRAHTPAPRSLAPRGRDGVLRRVHGPARRLDHDPRLSGAPQGLRRLALRGVLGVPLLPSDAHPAARP